MSVYMSSLIGCLHVFIYFLDGGDYFSQFISTNSDLYIGVGIFGAFFFGLFIWLRDNWRNLGG